MKIVSRFIKKRLFDFSEKIKILFYGCFISIVSALKTRTGKLFRVFSYKI